MAGEWEQLGPASFKIDGEIELKFMLVDQGIGGGNRVPKRERVFRNGRKLDFTGTRGDDFALTAIFNNALTEPGMGDYPQMWPDRLDRLEAAFKTGKTGTLHLPWRRNIRCKPETWSRRATAGDERDGETLTVTFLEDNEDTVDEASTATVSVQASVLRKAAEAVFDLEKEGAWDGSFEDFTQLAADLEGVLAAPGEFLADVVHKAGRVRRAADSIRKSLSSRAPGRDHMLGPEGAQAERRLVEIMDLAGLAEAEASSHLPKIVTRTFPTDRDIYSIATELGQSARGLIAINGQIEDLAYIPAGTPVHVFA
jgi:hypothetical protein